jgi:outer membrane protein OmpA-like peptidoglycan-associated protein
MPDPTERDKWEKEVAFKERELSIKENEFELKKQEKAPFSWKDPLVLAITAATIAALGNLAVILIGGILQQNLEKKKSEQTRILEMIKTGDPDKAAKNLKFLWEAGLISDTKLSDKLDKFLRDRKAGEGPALPSALPINPPMARLTLPVESAIKVPVTMDGSGSSTPNNDILNYVWEFGDGQTTLTQSPRTSHSYDKAGSYVVRLTVLGGKGGPLTASSPIAISQNIVQRLEQGSRNVSFDSDKADLKPTAVEMLNPIVQSMHEDSALEADLVGHVDNVENVEDLSKQRAEAVRNYLVSQGIAASRIRVDGKGKSEPASSNASDEGRANNRRVVITLSKLQP